MKYLRRCRSRSRAGQRSLEGLDEPGRRPLAVTRQHAGHLEQAPCIAVGRRLQQPDDRGLPLPFQHAVDRAARVVQQLARHERRAVPPDEDEHPRPYGLCLPAPARSPRARSPGSYSRWRSRRVPTPAPSAGSSRPIPPASRSAARRARHAAPTPPPARSPAAPAAGRSWCTSGDWDGRQALSWVVHRDGLVSYPFATRGHACNMKPAPRPEGFIEPSRISIPFVDDACPDSRQSLPIRRIFTGDFRYGAWDDRTYRQTDHGVGRNG